MVDRQVGRVIPVIILFHCLIQHVNSKFQIPPVQFEVLTPKGLRVSIPESANITLFVFQGNVNRKISSTQRGEISGEVVSLRNGLWTHEDPDIQLNLGDVIDYYVLVSNGEATYLKDKLSYTVKDIEHDNKKPDTASPCKRSVTEVRGSQIPICSQEIVFEENFDSLRENVWQIQQKLPIEHPEYPFVSYQRLSGSPTVKVENGLLRIVPSLLESMPGFSKESIYSGTLDLYNGCTGNANECFRIANGANILPPIVSGRISSKGFVFKYGYIEIRAKLPQGDWLYPEILLESFSNRYSKSYSSGVIKIASALGNIDLHSGSQQFGNRVLYGGPIMNFSCLRKLLKTKASNFGGNWGDDFHKYGLRWEPDRLVFLVDDVIWGSVEAGDNGLQDHFTSRLCKEAPLSLWSTGSKLAPFDEEFYLTLGVAAGGITDFLDGVYSGGRRKPWTNTGSKAKLRFWQDQTAWFSTWGENSALLVDYVKVTAL